MAGFRGVIPSPETIAVIAANLERSRQAMIAKVVAGADPAEVVINSKGDGMSIGLSFSVNAGIGEVFAGLLTGEIELVPCAGGCGFTHDACRCK